MGEVLNAFGALLLFLFLVVIVAGVALPSCLPTFWKIYGRKNNTK